MLLMTTLWCAEVPVICNVPVFADFEKGFSDQINLLVAMIDVPQEYQKSQIRDPIRNFMRRVFLCPGSESNHDAEPGGLAKHTLEVCRLTLENVKQNPDLNYKDRLAAFVVALLHDVTRANQCEVTDVSPNLAAGGKKALVWAPTHESMARWVEENHITSVKMEFGPKREDYKLSEALACLYILRIFHESLRTLIGQHRDAAIIAALTARLPKPALDLRTYMKGADRIMAARAFVGVTQNDHHQIWEALHSRVLSHSGWNEEPYYFLASPSHILITYAVKMPDTRVEQFWSNVHALLKGTATQKFDDKKIRQVVLDILKRELVSCCTTGDIEVDALFFVEVDGKRRLSIAIPWQNMVGRAYKKPRIDLPPPPVRFYSRKPEAVLTIEPADLGFTAVSAPDATAIVESTHLTELWRLVVSPPLTPQENDITDVIIECGRIEPAQKIAVLEILRRRLAFQKTEVPKQPSA